MTFSARNANESRHTRTTGAHTMNEAIKAHFGNIYTAGPATQIGSQIWQVSVLHRGRRVGGQHVSATAIVETES